jgi:hypothetical protein
MYVPPWLYETSDFPDESGTPVVQSTMVVWTSQVPSIPNPAGACGFWALMVDRDIANALTIATIANVIEVNVILFMPFFPSLVSQSIWLCAQASPA